MIKAFMTKLVFTLLLLCQTAVAQHSFNIQNASSYFDVKVTVAHCERDSCQGKASFAFMRKGQLTPYQVIVLPETYIELEKGKQLSVNTTLLYDKQSVVNVGDFNFDGMEDVALCNGLNGSYGMPSYAVYLSSRAAKKFVYNPAFSKLGTHLGMFEIDTEKKVLRTFDKGGCCFHVTEEFLVSNNTPRKIFSEEEDATIADETKVKITTKRFINGKWQSQISYRKRDN